MELGLMTEPQLGMTYEQLLGAARFAEAAGLEIPQVFDEMLAACSSCDGIEAAVAANVRHNVARLQRDRGPLQVLDAVARHRRVKVHTVAELRHRRPRPSPRSPRPNASPSCAGSWTRCAPPWRCWRRAARRRCSQTRSRVPARQTWPESSNCHAAFFAAASKRSA